MADPGFVVYVDEAGDEGFQFEHADGSRAASEWFILSAVIVSKANDLGLVELGKRSRKRLGWVKDREFHFRYMKHNHRRVLLDEFSRAPVTVSSVLFHKPSSGYQVPSGRLYRYACRLLLERVSWFCRDSLHPQVGDGSAKIIFSNKANLSYDVLSEYLRDLESWNPGQISWSHVRPDQIEARPARQLMGLQLADAAASSFYTGVSKSDYGLVDPGYVRAIKHLVYQYNGKFFGYGVKILPNPAETPPDQIDPDLCWLVEDFGDRR